jgi:hypothetical protein
VAGRAGGDALNETEILKTLDRIWERSNVRTAIYGRLGKQDGTVADIEVIGRPGYVYVSMGDLGDQGINIAKDKAGVARTVFQQVKMRRELGELVIYEAAAYAGGTGGTGGATSFFDLTDVNPVGWDNGEVPTWNSISGKFDPTLPTGGGGGGSYVEGPGIDISGTLISAVAHPTRGIIIDASGIGVKGSTNGGLAADANGLYIHPKSNSGLAIDSTGIGVGAGDGIDVAGTAVAVDVSDLVGDGIEEDGSNNFTIKLDTNSGMIVDGGGLSVGNGDGIVTAGNYTKVKVTDLLGLGMTDDGANNFKVLLDTPNSGLNYGPTGGLEVGQGDGIGVVGNDVAVRLSQPTSGLDFGPDGGLLIGEGDGIDVETNTIKVNVVEIINPAYGIYHDGSNNIVVALEPDSGLRYNDPSGRLELGEPGTLHVNSVNELIDDTHFHQVLTSSDPGSTEKILATDVYGGLRLDTDLLYVDAANNRVGINTIPENEWGAATLDVFAANPADHTQRIKQMLGQTGRMWRIEDSGGDELIVLDSVGNLQSGKPGFVSGLTGWQITPQGNAEFNNIWARGELHATVFVKDEVHATGGTFMVATAATFYEDATLTDDNAAEDELWVVSAAAGTGPLEVVTTSTSFEGNTLWVSNVLNEIKLNHPPSGPATYFQPGEILRVKTEIYDHDDPVYDGEGKIVRLADVWLIVNQGDASNEEYGLYSVQKVSGSNCVIPKGTAIVTYGKPGDGAILMTSDWRPANAEDGDDGYAPYIDVFTTGQQPWLATAGSIVPHVRMGQLKGVGLPGFSGENKFGIVMGQDLSDPNSAYMGASSEGIEIYRGLIRLNNGVNDTGLWDSDGNFKLGKNISQDATTGFRVITTGEHAGDVIIGDVDAGTNFVRWDANGGGANVGTLVIRGDLLVEGSGGGVSAGYVKLEDDKYLGYAEQYTRDQIALIDPGGDGSAYADSRRVLSIDAVFASSAYNVISWGAFSIYLANGTTRTVAANTSYTLNASFSRFWMWVDLNVAGTLTINFANAASAVNQPSYVLLGVVTKGASTPASSRASVTVVAGSTYISGASIFTGSITTASLAASAITTDRIAARNVTADRIAVDVFTSIDRQKVKAIYGIVVPTPKDPGPLNEVRWSTSPTNILRIVLANDRQITVLAGNRVITGRQYAYVVTTAAQDDDVTNATLLWYRPDTSDTYPANALVVAVCEQGVEAASAVMTNGGVTISGSDIVAGSITADRILANSIGAGQISAGLYTTYQADITAYGESRRVLAVTGTFTSTGPSKITWSGVRVLQADGTTSITIRNSSVNYPSGYTLPGSRTFMVIPPNPAATEDMLGYTNIDNIPAGSITICVCDTGTESASIVQTGGGVVISGDDIVADSIVATKLKANTLTTDQVEAGFFTSNNTTQATAIKGDLAKITIVSVSGKIGTVPATVGRFTWPSFTVKFAEPGRLWDVPASAPHYQMVGTGSATRAYFYLDTSDALNSPMRVTESVTSVPVTGIILGVGERGTTYSSVTMTYGGVIISGNHIVAGSIKAQDIEAANLSSLASTTGVLEVTTAGNIHSTGKTTASDNTAGFFLGWDEGQAGTGVDDAYKFVIGDTNNYFKWLGPAFPFTFSTKFPLTINSAAGADVLRFVGPSEYAQADIGITHLSTGMQTDGDWKFLGNVNVMTSLTVSANATVNGNTSVKTLNLANTAANDYTALTFTEGGNSGRFRFGASTAIPSRLDWMEDMYIEKSLVVKGGLQTSGAVLGIKTMSPLIGHSNDVDFPGSPGDISWHAKYLYIYVPADGPDPAGWRRIGLGPAW